MKMVTDNGVKKKVTKLMKRKDGVLHEIVTQMKRVDGVLQTTYTSKLPFYVPEYTGDYALEGTAEKGQIKLLTSGTLTLSEAVYDVFMVNGGNSGSSGSNDGANGGGSGFTDTVFGATLLGEVNVVIGAGALPNALKGGTTYVGTLSPKEQSLASTSTQGGSNANGGSNGSPGQGVTTRAFEESTNTLYAGAGGKGGKDATNSSYDKEPTPGGDGGGGDGIKGGVGQNGEANTGGGGGGGGFRQSSYTYYNGGSGGSGIVIIRWGYN